MSLWTGFSINSQPLFALNYFFSQTNFVDRKMSPINNRRTNKAGEKWNNTKCFLFIKKSKSSKDIKLRNSFMFFQLLLCNFKISKKYSQIERVKKNCLTSRDMSQHVVVLISSRFAAATFDPCISHQFFFVRNALKSRSLFLRWKKNLIEARKMFLKNLPIIVRKI